MHDKNWIKTISDLKKLNDTSFDFEKNEYIVTYKEQKQRNNRAFSFHAVQYIDETKMFIFTMFDSDCMTGELKEGVSDRIEIFDIEIISYEAREKNSFFIPQ